MISNNTLHLFCRAKRMNSLLQIFRNVQKNLKHDRHLELSLILTLVCLCTSFSPLADEKERETCTRIARATPPSARVRTVSVSCSRISRRERPTPNEYGVTFWGEGRKKRDRVDLKKRSSKLYRAWCSFRKQEAAMYAVDECGHVTASRFQ